ncbi:protein MMS22-like [Halyomorpha halys]|uniref:protein MMS22-like n=1 Tax=Halyomorpha halys TaxID=286706 RepID=UPI0006D4D7FC|nr:protein MMS22-like [Halyomorpha halys]
MSEDWDDLLMSSEDFFTTSIQTERLLTNKSTETNEKKFRCFDCLGDVNPNKIEVDSSSYYSVQDECNSGKPNKTVTVDAKCGSVTLFDKQWDKSSLLNKYLDSFFKMASKEMLIIEQAAMLNVNVLSNFTSSNTQQNYKKSRFYCIEYFLFLRDVIKCLSSDIAYDWILKEIYPRLKRQLKALKRNLGSLINLPDYMYAHSANTSGNKCSHASYHLMHLHFDLRWILLTSLHVLSKASFKIGSESGINDEIDADYVSKQTESLITELLELSVKRFEKLGVTQLRFKSPFSCTCVQELWLLLIKFCNNILLDESGKGFWDFIITFLDVSLQLKRDEGEVSGTLFTFFKNNTSKSTIFSLWFLHHIARLSIFTGETSSSYSLLESNLKFMFNQDINESNLRICMFFIEKLCLEIWEPKPQIVLILWEYFYKNINSSFYVPGAPPNTIAFMSKTAAGLVEQSHSFLNDINNVSDSFQHFLRIIGLHLKKTKDSPRSWNLLKGRLYSKLSLAKFESLSQVGEYHFISLFLTVAIAQDVVQIESKMNEIVNAYMVKNNCLNERLFKGQLAIVILLLEAEKDISCALQPVANYISSLNINEEIEIIRMYVESLRDILNMDQPLTFGQHLLIDNWISSYLCFSSENDISRFLDILIGLLIKLKKSCNFEAPDQREILIMEKLWEQLNGYLGNVTSQPTLPHQISDIAGEMANVSLLVGNKTRFLETVNMFTSKNISDISILRRFICNIMKTETARNYLPQCDKIILKTWIQCCFMCPDVEHGEMQELTRAALKLPEIYLFLSTGIDEILNSKDPLLDFLLGLHCKYVEENDIFKKQMLREKLSMYFDGLDKCVKPFIANPRDVDQILRLYTIVGNMFRLVSPLLYMKSKPNTILQLFVDLLLLPLSVRNPEVKIHPHILSAIKLTLHLFIEGLLQLDPESDLYIARILKELIATYIPRCMNAQNYNSINCSKFVLVSSFDVFDERSRRLVVNAVCNNFLKRKSRIAHEFAFSALKFIKEIASQHKTNEDVMNTIIAISIERVCDVVMYCDDKSNVHALARTVLNFILNNQLIRTSNMLGDSLMSVFSSLCHEHLAWSSRQLFELFTLISSEAPDLVKRFVPILQEQIKEVETKRGVGYDRMLRLGLEKIEMKLRAIKNRV